MWYEPYIIDGGMYGGRTCADGSLQWIIEHCTNTAGGQHAVRGYGGSRSTDEPYNKWEGAYGVNWDLLRSYIRDHDDGNDHEFVLLEIMNDERPEGAQYYRDSIVIKLKTNATFREITVGQPPDDRSLAFDQFEYWVFKICRREYPTPYSPYTDTDITTLSVGMSGNIIRGGETDLLGTSYYVENTRFALGTFNYGNPAKAYWGIAFYDEIERGDQYNEGVDWGILGVEIEELDSVFGGTFSPAKKEDPNEEEPPEDGPGGGGSGGGEGEHILPDEPVPIPPVPEIGAASVSWLKLFKMSTNQLNDFGEAMMPKTAWQLLQIYFTNPLDAIIGVLLIPVNAPTNGARTPALGDFTWPSAYPIINNEFYELDCGAIHIPPYWDSAFDMSPFTRFQVFLPFIGYRDIDADEIMGAGVHIKYHIDLCTGDCTAFIARSATPEDEYGPRALQVIAQYNGNCAVRVPTGRISHDSAVTASMSLLGSAINVGGAIMGAALGNPGNISASQVANQVSGGTMTAVNGFKKELQRSGNIAAAAGYMGIMRPYIIRQIPRQDLPKEYKRLEGYPANKGGTLAQFAGTGLNTVEAMELNGFDGFESEREELLSILRGGVIV